MGNNSVENTNWNISNDIYDIVDSVNNLQKRYISDEEEATLALGIYGFLADTESKKIQTSVIMTGKLGNEMFPTRAQLTKNVLTHAIYNNIPDINAVPAQITLNMGIKTKDIDNFAVNNKFIVDSSAPIFIGPYEFHFDYDIIITRNNINSNNSNDDPQYVYSAQYDMTEENKLSNIINQYLKQPFTIKIGNDYYVIFQSVARQYSINETTDKVTSSSLIENRTFIFDYDNQLAWFDVYITDYEGEEKRLTPLLYGENINGIEDFCWYLFLDDNTIRITFDARSIVPTLNSNIRIKAYTTLGNDGNFKYTKVDKTSEGYYVDISSAKYNYNVSTYMVAVTDSANGNNRKTKAELQKLIPKAAMSRGSLTTETDINNYFNLIDDENNRLVLRKKVDNQLNRVWYGYFLLKDEFGNIIPTNTIDLSISNISDYIVLDDNGKYILPAGTMIRYNTAAKVGEVIDEADIPEPYSNEYYGPEYYYYTTIYNIIICPDPLFTGFTSTIIDKDSFFKFDNVNENAPFQFVANRCNFRRKLLEEQSKYRFNFAIAQSIINSNFITYEKSIISDDNGDIEQITNNVKTILVLYNDDKPYRWVECKFNKCTPENMIFYFSVDLTTDNMLDSTEKLKIVSTEEFPLMVAGYTDSSNYGYFNPNIKAKLFVLVNFVQDTGTEAVSVRYEGCRDEFDDIAPGLYPNYTVTNVYEVDGGLQLYEHFTNIVNSRIDIIANNTVDDSQNISYGLIGIPVVGYHYIYRGEEYVQYLFDAIYERKSYIDYCLNLVENNMNIDFNFFNTYGPSVVYSIGDAQNTMIGHIDLNMKFRLSIKSTADVVTKDNILESIKSYMENLYDTGNWDAPSMITEIMNEYSDRINFIEFMNFNDFWLGVQHIWKVVDENGIEVDDNPNVTPEFLNIRNILDNDGNLIPDIEIEII